MKKQLIAATLAVGMLLPSVTVGASAAEVDTSRQDFMELFFANATDSQSVASIASISDDAVAVESNIIPFSQGELETPELGEPIDGIRQANTAYTVGDTDSFGVMLSSEITSASGTLKYQGEHCNIWLISQDTTASPGAVTNVQYEAIADRADDIYDLMVSEFAAHEDVAVNFDNATIGDVGSDGRINLLLYDIFGDGTSASGYTAGFFYSGNFFTSVAGTVVDAIHMDIGTAQGYKYFTDDGASEDFYSTIAHEFQHMLFFMYCGYKVGSLDSELTWFNEALSALTEMYYSTGVPGQTQDAADSKMVLANQNSYTDGATSGDYADFLNFGSNFKNYGMVNLFSSMMQQQTNGEYGKNVYTYLKTLTYDQSITAETLIGNALKAALGSDFDAYSAAEVFTYVYEALMENYITDGGTVVTEDGSYTTYSLWEGEESLWSYKDLATTRYSGYSTAYDTLSSGGTFSLVGYPSDSDSVAASHEITLKLDATTVDGDTHLNITVPETDGLQAYVALYDDSSETADLYPLTLGAVNEIDTHGKTAYLFASTLYADVEEVAVTYSWSAEGYVPQGTLQTEKISGFNSTTICLQFAEQYGGIYQSDLFIALYQDGKMIGLKLVEDVTLTGTISVPIDIDQAFDNYGVFLADEQWGYIPLVTGTTETASLT